MNRVVIAICAVLLTSPLGAQWIHHPTPGIPRTADGKPDLKAPAPRTAAGKPDLTGVWDMTADGAVGNLAVRNVGDLKPQDIQPWAQALVKERSENFGRDNPAYRCLPEGPGSITEMGMKRFVQTPGMMVIINEDLTSRVIFLDGRSLEAEPNPSWMGYSVGHWDGDTLIVESNGFNDRTWLVDGYPHTEKLRMTERYRRTDFGHLEIALTFDDPGAYLKPWTVRLGAQLAPDTEQLESVCNDNADSGQQHWVGKTSDAEKSKARIPSEILAKYVGVYRGRYLRDFRTVEVTLSDGALYISLNGGPKQPIVPQSETNFSGTGLTYQFVRNDQGIATRLIEGHVSGDYTYERQK